MEQVRKRRNGRPRYPHILFLDIDGVLITSSSDNNARTQRREFVQKHGHEPKFLDRCRLRTNEESMRALNAIVEECDAYIVVSSQWREGASLVELREILASMGLRGKRIVGKTGPGDVTRRGELIGNWLRSHGSYFESFIIIDDYPVGAPLNVRQIETSIEYGLTEMHVPHAKALFEQECDVGALLNDDLSEAELEALHTERSGIVNGYITDGS